ncbi:hypothetical protein MOQ72_28510 [Saccharopolyspora sp. K220]|uniref:hypothetical protein n=1 Tax=Saccharopolyspora soli TaxID=2926618 RepID=UPI001F564E11|nr:hypothetical protein [Saccharopolyspora soli]MCI2421385.1 hypothetical protein [Saccharopolyspora soli]
MFTEAQFDHFFAHVRAGHTHGPCLDITRRDNGTYAFRSTVPQPCGTTAELEFTEAEVLAFLDGIAQGDFDRNTTPNMALCR